MGMAASQAKLLTLTARLHDIEYKAQNIESQKIQLATQRDELYQEYCAALDATSFKIAYSNGVGGNNLIDANFATVCMYNENCAKQYSLRNNKTGKIIVNQDMYNAYQLYNNDKYAFAAAMLGMSEGEAKDLLSLGINKNYDYMPGEENEYGYNPAYGDADNRGDLYMTPLEAEVYEEMIKDPTQGSKLESLLNAVHEAREQDHDTYKAALDKFRTALYTTTVGGKTGAQMIYERRNGGEECTDFNINELKYYANLWTEIHNAGGCEVLSEEYQSGEEGCNWFKGMIESGQVSIREFNASGHADQWTDTSFSTSTNQNYLQEVQDTKDLKKAEAKYEYELGVINRKDTKYDTELSKLETERSSITTEMDSIKKVRDDNVERTFGIFS